jgi:VIT1/CCC1 family predicted Fe2+/Mn2+ transporter
MKHSLKTGFSFGLISGIITTLGLMVGLHSGTHSKLAVVGGILTIAIADAFSDALGIHISEESENKHTPREIWESTFSTFVTKFIFAMTFLVPLLIFELGMAIIVSLIWGFFCMGFFSYLMAKEQKVKAWVVIAEHVIIGVVVVVSTHFVGELISKSFGSS